MGSKGENECTWHISACRQGKASRFPAALSSAQPSCLPASSTSEGASVPVVGHGSRDSPTCLSQGSAGMDGAVLRRGVCYCKTKDETLLDSSGASMRAGLHAVGDTRRCQHSGVQDALRCTALTPHQLHPPPHSAPFAPHTSMLSSCVTNGHAGPSGCPG